MQAEGTGGTPSNSGSTGSTTTPPDNLDAILRGIYETYESQGMSAVLSTYSKVATFSGDSVAVEIHGNGGDFTELASEVASLDSQISVTNSSSTYQQIDATVPITDLTNLAQDADHLVQSVTVQPPFTTN